MVEIMCPPFPLPSPHIPDTPPAPDTSPSPSPAEDNKIRPEELGYDVNACAEKIGDGAAYRYDKKAEGESQWELLWR